MGAQSMMENKANRDLSSVLEKSSVKTFIKKMAAVCENLKFNTSLFNHFITTYAEVLTGESDIKKNIKVISQIKRAISTLNSISSSTYTFEIEDKPWVFKKLGKNSFQIKWQTLAFVIKDDKIKEIVEDNSEKISFSIDFTQSSDFQLTLFEENSSKPDQTLYYDARANQFVVQAQKSKHTFDFDKAEENSRAVLAESIRALEKIKNAEDIATM